MRTVAKLIYFCILSFFSQNYWSIKVEKHFYNQQTNKWKKKFPLGLTINDRDFNRFYKIYCIANIDIGLQHRRRIAEIIWPGFNAIRCTEASLMQIRDFGGMAIRAIETDFIDRPPEILKAAVGRLFIKHKFSNEIEYHNCTGTLIGPNHVLTCGHAVLRDAFKHKPAHRKYRISKNSMRYMVEGITFVPKYRKINIIHNHRQLISHIGFGPYGEYKVVKAFTFDEFYQKTHVKFDMSLLVLADPYNKLPQHINIGKNMHLAYKPGNFYYGIGYPNDREQFDDEDFRLLSYGLDCNFKIIGETKWKLLTKANPVYRFNYMQNMRYFWNNNDIARFSFPLNQQGLGSGFSGSLIFKHNGTRLILYNIHVHQSMVSPIVTNDIKRLLNFLICKTYSQQQNDAVANKVVFKIRYNGRELNNYIRGTVTIAAVQEKTRNDIISSYIVGNVEIDNIEVLMDETVPDDVDGNVFIPKYIYATVTINNLNEYQINHIRRNCI